MFEELKVDGIKKEISLNYKIVLLKKNFKTSPRCLKKNLKDQF